MNQQSRVMYLFPTDVQSITVGETGHTHVRAMKSDRLESNCLECAPYFKAYGADPDLSKVRLTYEERLARQRDERSESIVAGQLTRAIAEQAGATLRAG